MPPPTVRRAVPGDEDRVREIMALLDDSTDPEAVARFLASPTDYVVIAEIDGAPAGIAIAHELRRLDRAVGDLFLYSIDTLEPFRRQGVARAMIEHLKRLARDRGATEMFLLTNRSNHPAMALYAATGGQREADDEVMWVYPLSTNPPADHP